MEKWLSEIKKLKFLNRKSEKGMSIAEKRELLPLIVDIMVLTESARLQGLLELEQFASSENMPPLLKKGIQMGVNGIPTDEIIIQLMAISNADDVVALDQLKNMLIIKGVEGILQGVPPERLREKLGAYLGSELLQELSLFKMPQGLSAFGYTCDLKRKTPKTNLDFAIDTLNIYSILDDETFKSMLENMYDDAIAVILSVSDKELEEKIMDNLPENRLIKLRKMMTIFTPYYKHVEQASAALSIAMNEQSPVKTIQYEVFIDDNYENFSCDGGNGQALQGTYDNLEEAIAVCKNIIDVSLPNKRRESDNVETLFKSWKFGGASPFIRGIGSFSAEDYVEERLKVILSNGKSKGETNE